VRKLLSGIQAIARGAIESGVHVAAACPGPFSAEVLDALEGSPVACERVPSERVALQEALGASLGGARALCVVRPGGLSGTLDLLQAASAANAAGLVVVSIDDPSARLGPPGDVRLAARDALLPVVEPSDARECKELLAAAYDLSDRFETPVVVRVAARLADSADAVALESREGAPPRGQRVEPFPRPGAGGAQRARAMERLALLAAYAWDTPVNRLELRSADLGVVTSGLAYGMVREARPEASVLKLGIPVPVPTGLVREFATRVRRLVVVEELEPCLEQELRAAGIPCEGRNLLTRAGELTPGMVARALGVGRPRGRDRELVSERPPELCPGCPHRATASALKRLHVTVNGDLGCAALAGQAPLSAVTRAPALGAAVGVTCGLEAALDGRIEGRQVALVGEGALLHSALPALARAATGSGTIVVADNGPSRSGASRPRSGEGDGGGVRAPGGWRVDLGLLSSALGVSSVREVDPFDLEGTIAVLREELARTTSSVVIARSPCARLRVDRRPPMRVNAARCNRCGACLRLGCAAVSDAGDLMAISADRCQGCGLCAQVCRARAISPGEPR